MIVDVASTIPNAESRPNVKSVVASSRAQKLGALKVSIAAGYATKANPMELMSFLTGESMP